MHCAEIWGYQNRLQLVQPESSSSRCSPHTHMAHRPNVTHTMANTPRLDSDMLVAKQLVAADTSKGLPLPPAAPPPFAGAGAGAVEDGKRLSSGSEVCAGGLVVAADGGAVVAGRPLRVEVDMEPVTTPDGPTAMGTMTCSVWPLLSVVVLVSVERTVLVSSGAS